MKPAEHVLGSNNALQGDDLASGSVAPERGRYKSLERTV